MRCSVSGALAALASFGAIAQASLAEEKLANFNKIYNEAIKDKIREAPPARLGRRTNSSCATGCTTANTRVRKEWSDLSIADRQEYIDAVKCLQAKPSTSDPSYCPGCVNRVDDFAALHVDVTPVTHLCGWFLPWHRNFVWLFETALIEECGYTGAQPYWDWTLNHLNFADHPLFDGSPTSFGGNGVYVEHEAVNATIPGLPDDFWLYRPKGTGGGCVPDGAFAGVTMNLGFKFPYGDHDATGLEGATPHCLTRNWNQDMAKDVLTAANVATALSQPDLTAFRGFLDNSGLHPVGHDAIGGDVADIFTSPQDPLFFLHHGNVDRLWSVWQQQDPDVRVYQCSDTRTMLNSPPSDNAEITDYIPFMPLAPDALMQDIVDPLDNGFCYRYE